MEQDAREASSLPVLHKQWRIASPAGYMPKTGLILIIDFPGYKKTHSHTLLGDRYTRKLPQGRDFQLHEAPLAMHSLYMAHPTQMGRAWSSAGQRPPCVGNKFPAFYGPQRSAILHQLRLSNPPSASCSDSLQCPTNEQRTRTRNERFCPKY